MDFSKVKEITIPEGKVIKIMSGETVLWEKTSLPSEYQQVAWLRAETGADTYLDLGFAFDTKARIKMSQYIEDPSTTTYPFGAAENSGTLRCMLSMPYAPTGYGVFYGSTGDEFVEISDITYVLNAENHFVLTLEKGIIKVENNTNGYARSLLNMQGEYAMTNNLYLFAQHYNDVYRVGGMRQIGYFQYYDKNDELICDLIPCYRKSDGEIGMYDMVRKMFLTNAGSGVFIRAES